jgi:hypothetical protein
MGNPILMVKNGGMGETPIPADARFMLGGKVSINTDDGWLDGTVTAIVPAGVSPDIAFADHTKQARPLMCMENRRRTTTYIVTVDPAKPSYWISKPKNIRQSDRSPSQDSEAGNDHEH